MKKILLLILFSSCVFGQQLKIPYENLFSPEASKLQPLCVLLIPGTPIVSFCSGFSGHFEKLPQNLQKKGKYGMIVTAILVDKKAKKIIDNIGCTWESLDSSILKAVDVNENEKIKRAFLLIPQKKGVVGVKISMGNEKTILNIKIEKNDDNFKFEVLLPPKSFGVIFS